MASVFLSYDHEDSARAAPISAALEEAGHSVWWDRHIHGGAEYNREIESAVDRADAVVVLWSKLSVQSAWVRDEAAEGRDQGKLVPVLLDRVKPPMGFRQFQTIDLSKMRRGRPCEELAQLLETLSPSSRQTRPSAAVRTQFAGRKFRLFAVAAGIIFVLTAAFFAWRLTSGGSAVPVVKVIAADSSAASQGLARDLLVKLGSLRAAKTESMRLIGVEESKDRADLIVQTSWSNLLPQGNLSLLSGNNRALLWSKDFPRGADQTADEQQIAYTAGQVLACALEAEKPGQARLDQQTIKLFLDGCSQFADNYYLNPAAVVSTFSQIVAKVPQFQPAWRKLLLAQTLVARNESMFEDRFAPGMLSQDIAAARKLNPHMPEIYVAETELLPLNAYQERLDLLDKAVQLDPDNADVAVGRAVHLDAVGRTNDELDDLSRAVEIDPLSAGLRSILIYGLANAGRLSAAEQQLREAEALWPTAPAIQDARLRVNMLYGDPREALSILKSDTKRRQNITPAVEAHLAARLDPTTTNIQRAIDAASGPHLTNSTTLVYLVQLLGEFHRENEIYALLLDRRRTSWLGPMSQIYFRPTLKKFRQDPRFMQVAARAGLVDYWRRSGKWPDFCFEPGFPYDCKKEAAKVD